MRVFVYFCQYNCFLATREVKVKIKVDNFDLGSHSKVEIQISVRSTFLSLRPSHFQKATPLQLSRKSHHASEIRNKILLCPTPGTLPAVNDDDGSHISLPTLRAACATAQGSSCCLPELRASAVQSLQGRAPRCSFPSQTTS